jgi:hypothetical protein
MSQTEEYYQKRAQEVENKLNDPYIIQETIRLERRMQELGAVNNAENSLNPKIVAGIKSGKLNPLKFEAIRRS